MKRLVLSFVLTCAATATLAGDNAPLSGKWQVHNSIANSESDQSCTFTQKDNDLSGACTSDAATGNITGKVNGKKVNWTFKSEYNGSPLTMKFEGTIDSDTKITGSVSVVEFSVEGGFTATLSK